MVYACTLNAGAAATPAGDNLLDPAAGINWSSFGGGNFQLMDADGDAGCKITALSPRCQTGAAARIKLPRAARALTISGDYKAMELVTGEKAWHNGRIRIDFLDAQGMKLGESHAIDRLEGNSPAWLPVSRQFPVPIGAVKADIALELFLPNSGAIGFRNLRIRALDREEAGAWRVDADARIEKHRKAELSVRVVDGEGRPVPEAEVHVRMRRHAYPFGTAVMASKLVDKPVTEARTNYRDTILNFFNYVTLENDLKQTTIEKNTIQPAVDALHLLQAHGIQARGHVLVWPSWKMSAPSLAALQANPDNVGTWIRNHIRSTVLATRGLVTDWDVMNEPAIHHEIIDLIGREKVADWFRLARETDPKASLYLNENNVGFNGTNQEALANWITLLKSTGAPLDGVGWQGHMWQRTLPYAPSILDDLNRFEKFGIRIQITEYDCNDRFGDEEEAEFLSDFLLAWFSHPSTSGFIMWGFQDDSIWTGNAPLFNRDWSLKPAGKIWMDYVFVKWWSDADGTTDSEGCFATLGFHGDYVVQIVSGGKVETVETRLPKEGMHLTVALTAASPSWEDSRRIPDFNPYRSGKLPRILKIPPRIVKAADEITINTDHGRGADAVVGPSAALGGEASLSVAGAPDMKSRRDLYLRFDLSRQIKGALAGVDLTLKPLSGLSVPFRAKVYALSDRFVPAGGELNENWAESLITAANAPGREPASDNYRTGDAALIYLGDWRSTADGGLVRWQSRELVSAVTRSLGKSITLLIVPDEGVEASFRSKEYGSSDAPCLIIKYE